MNSVGSPDFWSQIDTEGFLKAEKAVTFYVSALQDKKVTVAKDHGKKFRSELTTSFSEIVHWATINDYIQYYRLKNSLIYTILKP